MNMRKLYTKLMAFVVTVASFVVAVTPIYADGGYTPYSPYSPYSPHVPVDTSLGGTEILIVAGVVVYVLGVALIANSKKLQSFIK